MAGGAAGVLCEPSLKKMSSSTAIRPQSAVTLVLCLLQICLLLHCLHTQALSHEGHVLSIFAETGRIRTPTTNYEIWDTSDDNPCAWFGVICNANSSVERLDFSGWELSGYLDLGGDALQMLSDALPSLKELDLSSNQLEGTFQLDVKGFKGLTRLDLSNNRFSGQIPATIYKLSSLRHLSLERNRFNGTMPNLDGLTNLQFISLSHNELSGQIPDMTNLSVLRGLDLSSNNFTGTFPNLRNLTNLLTLNLSSNGLTGCLPSLQKVVPKLQDLYLSQNQLESFETEDPHDNLPASLRRVIISGNRLQRRILLSFLGLPNLVYLDLSSNLIEDHIPDGIPNTNTTLIDLSRNKLGGSIPPDILSWGRVLNGCRPKQSVVAVTRTLNLSQNLLVGPVPLPPPGSSRITFDVLDLSYNQLEGSMPPISASVLWLRNNLLSGDFQNALLDMGNCPVATELRLDGNRFSGEIDLRSLRGAGRNLEVLDLSHNDFVAPQLGDGRSNFLQTMLENLMGLRELRLAGNHKMRGSLPSTGFARNFDRLEVLDLSRTDLYGLLPSGFLNSEVLPSLRVLNLSSNNMGGGLPASVGEMSNLTVMDISSNRLSGPLPDGLQPALLNRSFFSNNPGLCGFPLPACARLDLGLVLPIVLPCAFVAVACCVLSLWGWRVYTKKRQQDADLIATLMDREAVATLMPLRELKKATSNFSEASTIGVGGFGTVHKGVLQDGTTVAIKKSRRSGSERDKQQFLNEVRILCQVNHQNLVKLLGCCLENKQAALVFEYVPNGTLLEHLRGQRGASPLGWRQRLNIAAQTADALAYLHSAANPPIYHRDVKSANILLDEELNAKVADFGISKLAPLGATHVSTVAIQGTPGYIDPEYFASLQLNDKSDVYSFGVVLLELISAQPAVVLDRGSSYKDVLLATWAVPRIVGGHVQDIVDPVLAEVFGSEAGHQSIVKLAAVAVNCLAPSRTARSTMREVWREVHRLWLEAPTELVDVTVDQHPQQILQDGPGIHTVSNIEMSAYTTSTVQGDDLLQDPLYLSDRP